MDQRYLTPCNGDTPDGCSAGLFEGRGSSFHRGARGVNIITENHPAGDGLCGLKYAREVPSLFLFSGAACLLRCRTRARKRLNHGKPQTRPHLSCHPLCLIEPAPAFAFCVERNRNHYPVVTGQRSIQWGTRKKLCQRFFNGARKRKLPALNKTAHHRIRVGCTK